MDEPSHSSASDLPAIGVVADLDEAHRAALCAHGGFCFFPAGSIVIEQGSPQESLYLVLSGELHARRHDAGREILIGSIRQGESFGEMNIFDPAQASATVVAVAPTQIWRIGRDALLQFLEAYPAASVRFLSHLAALLSRRIRGLAKKLEDKVEYDEILAQLGQR